MSRPLRIQYEGAIYHVAARGNEQKRVFWEKIDYEYFLKLLEKASATIDVSKILSNVKR